MLLLAVCVPAFAADESSVLYEPKIEPGDLNSWVEQAISKDYFRMVALAPAGNGTSLAAFLSSSSGSTASSTAYSLAKPNWKDVANAFALPAPPNDAMDRRPDVDRYSQPKAQGSFTSGVRSTLTPAEIDAIMKKAKLNGGAIPKDGSSKISDQANGGGSQIFMPGTKLQAAPGSESDPVSVNPSGRGGDTFVGGDINNFVMPNGMNFDQWRQYQQAVQQQEAVTLPDQDPHSAGVEIPKPATAAGTPAVVPPIARETERGSLPTEADRWVEKKNEETDRVIAAAEQAVLDPTIPQEEKVKRLEDLVQLNESLGEADSDETREARQLITQIRQQPVPQPQVSPEKPAESPERFVASESGAVNVNPFQSALERERGFFGPPKENEEKEAQPSGRAPSRQVASYMEPPKIEPKEKKAKAAAKPMTTGSIEALLGMGPNGPKPAPALKKVSASLIRELASTMKSQDRLASRWLASTKRGEKRIVASLAKATAAVSPQLSGFLFSPWDEASDEDMPWASGAALFFALSCLAGIVRWKKQRATRV